MKRIFLFVLIFILITKAAFSEQLQCGSSIMQSALMDKIHSGSNALNFSKINKDLILQVPLKISKYITLSESPGKVNCQAYTEIVISDDVMKNIINKNLTYSPEAMAISHQYFPDGYHENMSDGVISQNIYFNGIDQDGRGLLIEINEPNIISATVYGVAWFKVNSAKISTDIDDGIYAQVFKDYEYADGALNEIWMGYSELIRNNLKKDAIQWINEKNKKCGKIEDLNKRYLSLSEETAVYKCQTNMTLQRIDILLDY